MLMNYKTYKTMTDKQKEEYNFRFANKTPSFNFYAIAGFIVVVFLSFGLVLLLSYLVVNDTAMAESIDVKDVAGLTLQFGKITMVFYILIAAKLIIYIIELITLYVKVYRFMKKNNIKRVRGKLW